MKIPFALLLLFFWIPCLLAQDSGNQNVDLDFPEKPLIQDSQFAQRERSLLSALKKNPDNASLQIKLARLYQEQRFYPRATAVLESVLARHPDIADAHFYLGQILGYQKTDPEPAIRELREAIRLQPGRIEYEEEIASIYYRFQRYPPALEHLDAILKLDPNHTDALYRKAVILYTQGKAALAEALTDRLPNHEHARVLRAIIVQQRSGDAKPLYEAILRDFPKNLRARYEYGKILFQEKKLPAAQDIFEKIIDEDPFYQHAVFYLVKIYSLTKQEAKAQLAKQSLDAINRMGRNERNFYRSYLRYHPDIAETHLAMGLIYLEIGRGNLSEQEFRRVLEFNPDHPDASFYLAQIAMASGEFREALPYLQTGLRVRKDTPTIHAMMAQCYLELNDAQNAGEHLNAALKLDPRNPLANRIRDLWNQRAATAKKK